MSRADDLYAKYSTSKRFSTKSTDKDEEKKKQYASKADELYDKYSTSRRFQSSLINADSGDSKEVFRFDTSAEAEPAKKTAVNFAQGENRFQTQSNTQPQPSIEKYPYNASEGKATIYAPKSFAEKEFMADGGAKNTLRKRQVQSFIDSTPVSSDPSYKNTLKSLDDEYTSKVNEINSTEYAPRERNFALREAELEYEIKKLNLIETTLIPEEDTEIKISVVPHDIGFGNNARRDQRNTFETNADKKIKEDAARKANPYYDDVQKAGQYKKKLSNELEALRSQRDEEREAVEEGQEIYEKIEDNDVLEIAFKLAAGVENGVTSIGNRIADKDYYAPSSWQIAASLATEDLNQDGIFLPERLGGGTLGGAIGDAAYSIGNMAPALAAAAAATYLSKGALGKEAAAMIGEAAFATTFGASAYGNAYAEAINNGYDKQVAGSYASAIAASEVLSNYFLGGISKVGGKLTNNALDKALDRVSSTALKTAAKFAGKVGSETFEEWGQAIVEPMLKNIILGESNEIDPLSPEALYSGLLGGFTALVLDGAPSAVSSSVAAARTYQTGKTLTKNNNFDVKNLVELGNKMSANSVAYKIANKVNDKTGAYTIGKLFHAIGAELSVQNQQDIVKSLTLKGVAPENAETIADWLGATVNGAKLTKQQINALELNEDIANTFRDVIINPNSTINQRRQAWFEAGGFDVASNADADMNAYSPDAVMDRINESQMLTTQSAPSLETQLAQLAQEKTSKSTEAPTAEQSNPFIPLAKQTAPVQNTEKIKALDSVVAKEHDVSDIEGKTIIKNTNEAVNIKKITSIDKNSMTLELDDGRVVSSKDVSYGTQGEALVYETVANMDVPIPADAANSIVSMYNPNGKQSAAVFSKGVAEAYRYGYLNMPKSEMLAKSSFAVDLTEHQRETAYKLGSIMSTTRAKADTQNVGRNKQGAVTKGRVTYTGNSKLTKRQRINLKALKVIANITGTQIEVFESNTDKYGKRLGENGSYDPTTGKIRIDLYAGINGDSLMLFTAAHELTHHIKNWSPEKFKVLADFLMEQYGEKGVSVDALVQAQIEKAARSGRTLTYEAAYEEVIADSMESMLSDGEAIAKLKMLATKDQSLVHKIRDFLGNLVAKIKKEYAGLKPDSQEGQLVADMIDATERLQSLFAEALMDATVNYTNAKSELVNIDAASESASPKLSERTWTASAYVQHREVTAQMLAKTLGVTKKKALEYIDDVNSIARLIADDRVRLDYEASPFGSAFVSNSEYGGSFDFTTLCKKRRLYTGTFSEIQKRLGDVALTPDEILEIRNMLIERNEEATCGLCYVEGSRANMGKFAKEFIRLYKRDNPNAWIPTMYDVNTPDGVESMKRMHPEAYGQYEFFWNHYGKLKADDKALFASQQKPKLYESRKEYKGEILEYFSKDTTVQAKNRNGGIRMQNFSDFELVHLIDTMQIIMDMASVGLSGQAYTKVPEFADAFGNTGLKINLSLIAKGVDENGKLIFDDREGMPHETAFGLRNKYSKNVGTIIVTFTDEQLYAAMADSRIDFIIPFHRSQWKKGQYQAMGLPQGTKDYTYMQNEKLIKQTYHEYRGKMVKDKASNYMPNEYWDFSKSGKENAEAYLEMCAKENKRPKFYKLLDYDGKGTYSLKKDGSTDGYWKLLIDFKMYDNNGVGSAQQPVTPNFSIDEAIEMLNEYKGGHQSYPVAHDVVDRFVESYNATNKNPTSDSDVRYSVREIVGEDGTNYGIGVHLDSQELDTLSEEERESSVVNHIKKLGGHPFSAFDNDGNEVKIKVAPNTKYKTEKGSRERANRHLTNFLVNNEKQEALMLIDEIIGSATFKGKEPATKAHGWLDNNGKNEWDVWATYIQDKENTIWVAKLKIANTTNGEKVLYDVHPIEKVGRGRTLPTIPTDDTISQPTPESQEKFSDRDPDAITTRGLLADALESTVANDIERKKLADYKKKAKLMTAEEAKLAELRKQIKEASFSKGKRDTEKLKQLKEEATKTANRITTYDRQLLNLESTQALKNVLEREKKKAVEKQKQRDKELLAKKRQKAAEREQAIREEYRESRQKAVESRHKTEMRNKIKKVVNELNQYLLNGTKDKHVMEGMQKAVAEALSIVNMDTVDADARVAKYDALIAEATDPDVIEALTATRDRIQSQGDRLADKLASLKSAYADVINSSDPALSNAYDEVIEAKIASVVETVGDTSLRNMSMSQLEEVYDLYKMVLTNIRNANKLFASEKQETIEQLGYEVDSEIKAITKQKDKMTSTNQKIRKVGYKDLKPIYFFRMLGSDTMTDLYKKVRDGQNTWERNMDEAKEFRINTEKKHSYKEWDLKETHTFTAKSGKSFELTLLQIMSIYAYSRREQAFDHLIKGGIVFDDAVKVKEKKKGVTLSYTVNTSEAFNLSVDTLGKIIDTLTEEQKSYVKDMQSYLSDTMGGKGNEVSLELYGVKLFKEKNYFPLKSSQYYMNFTAEEAGETKIKNSSFSKETVKHANNPIVLSDFIDVWANHVNDMSMYHAFVLPLEDFTRVYNYRTPTSEDVETTSVKSTIHNHYTEAANSYIKQLLKDINGGSVSGVGTEVIDKMVGLAKKGAVFASASVTVQQPSAIFRSMDQIDPKYFTNASTLNPMRHKQLWEECKQYAPIAGIKEMGYFDTGVGRTGIDWLKADEFDSFGEKFVASFKSKEQFKNSANDALSFFPSMADELTWVSIWEAVKKETRKTTSLEVGSEEFFKHCGERFTEVVDLTQVYDSVFARSELMRSKDRSVKMATAFMAEATVQANMIFDSALQLKRGKKSFARAIKTGLILTAAVIVNSLLKSPVGAGRDDDEHESYLEKILGSFAGDALSGLNPLTLIPFVKDVISIIQGYSVERMDMSVIDSLVTAFLALSKETETPAEEQAKWANFVGAVTQLFGVPIKNIYRDVKGAFNTHNTLTSGNETTETGVKFALLEGLSGTVSGTIASKFGSDALDTSKGKQYYDAVMGGDTAHANRIVASYDDKKKADNAIVDALKKFEPRITEAAQAHIDGSTTERVRISKEIIADGFAQDYVVKAVNGMVTKLEKGEGESESAGKPKSLYTNEDYFNAAYNGNTSEANIYKEELIKFDMDTNDKTREEAESSLNSSFKKAVRKAVIEDGLTMEKATRMLADYGDVTEEKAYELAQGYDFVAQHPDLNYGWEADTVAKYLEKAEPAGISVSVYDDYLVKKSQCKGVDRNNDGKADKGTKKAQIYKMIDSLPITSHQKAVLKLMNK